MKRSQLLQKLIDSLSPFISIFIALLVGAIVILTIGENPVRVYRFMLRAVLGNVDGIGYVLFSATPLIFTGLAVAFAFRAGLFNIGGEGQLYVGTFLCAWVGFTLVDLPGWALISACILAGFFGGAVWGAIPGWLRAKFGVHEVINTIMLNFVALLGTNFLVNHIYKEPGQMIPQTGEIARQAYIPRLAGLFQPFGINLPGSNPLNMSFLLALMAAGGAWFILKRTRLGYEIRAVGLSRRAAEYGGIHVKRILVISMAISGALAGLVGVNEVMGYRHRFLDGFSTGLGFTGIAVALLGRNNPLGVVPAAMLFGALNVGALEVDIFTTVPRELVLVLQAVIIIFVVVGDQIARRLARRWK